MERAVVITGNWKMYKTIEEAVAFVKELAPKVAAAQSQVYLAVPFTTIQPVAEALQGTSIVVGAQNMNDASEGAFTGEVAGGMLKDAGAKFVILGHSERRHIFHESDTFVNRKVKRALADGLQPVLCVGETLQEHEAGQRDEVLTRQLTMSLEGVSAEQLAAMILAYEPVWAIGTNLSATPEQAESAHQFIRDLVAKNWNQETADALIIQYGGSVRPNNAKSLLDKPGIDGLLVGGASLNVDFFAQIVNDSSLRTAK